MAKIKVHNPLELGNDYGHLKFGHINMNNQLSGIMLRNGLPGQEVEHYMTMISSGAQKGGTINSCLLYTSPSPRDLSTSRMPSSA